jgi:hypothetical protein
MTFLELMMLLDSRGEKTVIDKTNLIQTDKFQYTRARNGEWEQGELPIKTIAVDPFPPLESVLPKLPKTKKKK